MPEGIIYKALSGFYYVASPAGNITCRARGKLRNKNLSPLVGDRVSFTMNGDGTGAIDEVLPRKNSFIRPAVANIDQMVVIASGAIPVTDPFLIDRIALISVLNRCAPVICINKCDLVPADGLYSVYRNSGFKTLMTSAKTGEGISELRGILDGKVSVFTGNSGVGKSSILNRMSPDFNIKTADVSQRLGRGRHTTRHIELYMLSPSTFIADTPGFSSFDTDILNEDNADEIVSAYPEFAPYVDKCRFLDCHHIKEQGCAVLEAVNSGCISQVRHANYVRLYETAKSVKSWQKRDNN